MELIGIVTTKGNFRADSLKVLFVYCRFGFRTVAPNGENRKKLVPTATHSRHMDLMGALQWVLAHPSDLLRQGPFTRQLEDPLLP